MADKRFFTNHGPFSLEQLVAHIPDATLQAADASRLIHDVAALDAADESAISFFTNVKYKEQLRFSKAAACIVQAEHRSIAPEGMDVIIAPNAHYAYALIAALFYPAETDIQTQAIADSVQMGKDVQLGEGCVIGEHVVIGDRVRIGANTVIGKGVVIGNHVTIHAQVTVSHALIGNYVTLFPGVRIGQDGFGFATYQGRHVSVPQLGRVIIGDYVEIGANSTVDRGAGPDTIIGEGSRIDNLVQIAHNVEIGKGCILVSQVGVAGSSVLEDYVVLGGQVGVAGHLRIGMGTQVAAQGGVIQNMGPGQVLGGTPTVPIKQWHKQSIMLARLAKRQMPSN